MTAPNTSATGGFLAPVDLTSPAQDAVFEKQLQAVVVGITGLPGDMVRRRWQPTPPKQPEAGVDWCAIGVTEIAHDGTSLANISHTPDGNGSDILSKNEIVSILASFYGPSCYGNAALFRDGLAVPQNREALYTLNMGLVSVGNTTSLPALVNQQWVRRVDLPFRLRRRVSRTYRVLNILEAGGTLIPDRDSGTGQDFSTET